MKITFPVKDKKGGDQGSGTCSFSRSAHKHRARAAIFLSAEAAGSKCLRKRGWSEDLFYARSNGSSYYKKVKINRFLLATNEIILSSKSPLIRHTDALQVPLRGYWIAAWIVQTHSQQKEAFKIRGSFRMWSGDKVTLAPPPARLWNTFILICR